MDRAITTESKDSEKSKNCSQMATSGSPPVPSRYIHTDKAGEKPRQSNTVAGLLGFLHDYVDSQIYTMPDAELEWFAGARDNAALMADNLGETIGNIAALVGHEVNFDHKEPKSGALQPSGLEQFLYHASDTIVTIGAMTEIAGIAAWALRDRWEQRARALGFKHSDSEENGNG